LSHQPRHRAAGDRVSFPLELLPDPAHPVDLPVLSPHAAHPLAQGCVPSRPRWAARRLAVPGLELVVQRRGDRRDGADRVDPVDRAVGIDEGHHHFARRSSSAWAKYAEAFRRISLARRSSMFLRSSCRSRLRSSVVSPARRPASRSACRTQLRKVSAVQPSFPAIEVIAVHRESCFSCCSSTIRTARSTTSGENLLGLAMPHPLKEWSLQRTRGGSVQLPQWFQSGSNSPRSRRSTTSNAET